MGDKSAITQRSRFAPEIKRGDWVRSVTDGACLGFVVRVARNGAWADVKWRHPALGEWSKRTVTSLLRVQHTIPLGGGVEITDMNRREELAGLRGRRARA